MGGYLNMLFNEKENPATGRKPNENFARELLQLFSIGIYELNLDGSLRLDGRGQPIRTYGQTEIQGFAKVFTGWTYAQRNEPFVFKDAPWEFLRPMMAIEAYHSTAPKPLLGGVVLPPNQTALKDLRDALDNVFMHPNVGPFIGYRLIQRLVTSNPSREVRGAGGDGLQRQRLGCPGRFGGGHQGHPARPRSARPDCRRWPGVRPSAGADAADHAPDARVQREVEVGRVQSLEPR